MMLIAVERQLSKGLTFTEQDGEFFLETRPMGKAAKLAASLGGNMKASIKGLVTDVTPKFDDTAAAAEIRDRFRDADAAKILLTRIAADPGQPRQSFDDAKLKDLGASMKTHGQLQACLVERSGTPPTRSIASSPASAGTGPRRSPAWPNSAAS